MPYRPRLVYLLVYALVTVAMVAPLIDAVDRSSFNHLSSSSSSSSSTTSGRPDRSTAKPASVHQGPKPDSRVLSAVESRLLTMFGLKSRPMPTTKVLVPEYMLQLYQRQQKLNRDSAEGTVHAPTISTTVRSFPHQETGNAIHHQKGASNHFQMWFNVSSLQATELLRGAELRLYSGDASTSVTSSTRTRSTRDVPTSSPRTKLRVLVYDVLKPETSSSEAIMRLIDSRRLDASQKAGAGWQSFDVFPAVVRWQHKPHTNHGLRVEVTYDDSTSASSASFRPPQDSGVRVRRSVDLDDRTWQSTRPMLVTFSDDSGDAKRRWRRSPERKTRRKPKHDSNQCRRHVLYVDFTDVGWNDWIVAPPGYNAYFCQGECNFPLAEHLNTTNHAVVQTLVNSVNPNAVPRACCVPTELSPISMLYLDEYEKVVLKNYQDMVVEGCGCR